LYVVERVKARAPLEICRRRPGEAFPLVKNHCIGKMRFIALC